MYVVCVTVFVSPEGVDAFVEATRDNHVNTRQEPGNLRFDVLRAEDDPTRFFLYEVYRSKESFASHQQTPHYLRWREAAAPLMAQPRRGVRRLSILPAEDGW